MTKIIKNKNYTECVRKKKVTEVESIEKESIQLSLKTLQNQKSMVKNLTNYCSDRMLQLAEYIIRTDSKTKEAKNTHIQELGGIYQTEFQNSPKGTEAYKFLSAISPLLKGVNISIIKDCFKISHEKAKLLSLGERVTRKPNIRKFPEAHAQLIKIFYSRNDISRIDNSARGKLKDATKRFLNFSVYTAYNLFQDSYPNIQVSESMFRLLMPSEIRFVSNIPLIACVCVYCENVRLMLFLFPGKNNEYELYTKLICEKGDNQRFYSFLCI